ncbi:MAG TPA: hypothetical protein DER01_08550 [Phycisphaerales bacterium]|nr:hypothetical protein [Phycisphaerales bacterium]|tara:strand:+ start:132 stop:974 length:843 start_codon:yes stop_codon:yes gene_type:complete
MDESAYFRILKNLGLIHDAATEKQASSVYSKYRFYVKYLVKAQKSVVLWGAISILLIFLVANLREDKDINQLCYFLMFAVSAKTVFFNIPVVIFYDRTLRMLIVECTHCEHVFKCDEAWYCPHCKEKNDFSDPFQYYIYSLRYSFLHKCKNCHKSPIAIQCPECHNPINLIDGETKEFAWWARLTSDTRILPVPPGHIERVIPIDEEIKRKKLEKENNPPTMLEKFKERIRSRTSSVIDLHKAKVELLEEAGLIEDPEERERVKEIIYTATEEIEEEQGI